MDFGLVTMFLVFSTAFLITYFVIPSILEVAYKKNLFDVPNQRKVHIEAIPSLGGVGIFIGVIIAFTIWMPDTSVFPQYKYILTAYMILFFMGLKDDLLEMKAIIKLFIQFLVAGILIYGEVRIISLFGIFGIETLPYIWSVLISLIFIVGVTNAFNLIDGIDGLAGGLGGINCMAFAGIFYAFDIIPMAILSIAITGALLAFLRYNFNAYPKKVFMGDTGSLLLGISVVILSISFMNANVIAPEAFSFVSPPIVVLGMIFIPILDMTRVVVIRLANGKSPFTADKNHIHHQFLNSGTSHKKASLLLYLINFILIVMVFIFRETGALGLILIIACTISISTQLLIFYRYNTRSKRRKLLQNNLQEINVENRFLVKD